MFTNGNLRKTNAYQMFTKLNEFLHVHEHYANIMHNIKYQVK